MAGLGLLALMPTACMADGGVMIDAAATVDGIRLTVSVPYGLEASPALRGLLLQRRGAQSQRRIYQIAITVVDGAADTPFPLDRSRGEGDRAVRYGLDRFDGGSGGEEITLIAQRPCGRGIVRLRFDAQAEEGGGVNLNPAFAILSAARCTPAT